MRYSEERKGNKKTIRKMKFRDDEDSFDKKRKMKYRKSHQQYRKDKESFLEDDE